MLILTKFLCCEIAKGIRKHVMKNRLTFSILLSTFNQTCAKAYCPLCPQILICKGASSSSSFSSFLFPSSSFPLSSFPFSSLLIILSCPEWGVSIQHPPPVIFLINCRFLVKTIFSKMVQPDQPDPNEKPYISRQPPQPNWLHSQFEGQRQPIRQPSQANPQVDSLNTDGVIIQNKK